MPHAPILNTPYTYRGYTAPSDHLSGSTEFYGVNVRTKVHKVVQLYPVCNRVLELWFGHGFGHAVSPVGEGARPWTSHAQPNVRRVLDARPFD